MSPVRQSVGVTVCMPVLVALFGCTVSAPPPSELAPPPAPAVSVLTEVGARMGIPSEPSWPDGTYFLPEIMGAGVAFLDYDGDGDLDLLQSRMPPPGEPTAPAPKRLLRQEAGGVFTDVTRVAGLADDAFGQGLAVADIDNDGDLDLFFANYGRDSLWRNAGDGTFEDATGAAGIADDRWSAAATFCDYDRDGWLDLWVTHYLRVDHRTPCRAASGIPDYCGPASFDGVAGSLYHNDGDGTFTDVSLAAGIVPRDGGRKAKGLGVVCLDLTADGWADFFVANDGEANHLWVNRQDGTFVEQAVERGLAVNRHGRAEANMGIAVGDVEGNGRLDLLVTHLSLENNTLYSAGTGTFADRTVEAGMTEDDLPYTGFGCALFDLDHDGDLDFAVANGKVRGVMIEELAPAGSFWQRYAEPNQLFANDGTGRFVNARGEAGPFAASIEVSRGLAVGDVDADGDLDLAVSQADNALRLYRNDAPQPGSHWLLVRALTGKRDALGAVVGVTALGKRRIAIVLPGSSYQSSNDPRVHFGLGGADAIEAIDVAWPDGSLERFPGGAADRELVLRQGTGEVQP